jgi:hypothetical protein
MSSIKVFTYTREDGRVILACVIQGTNALTTIIAPVSNEGE